MRILNQKSQTLINYCKNSQPTSLFLDLCRNSRITNHATSLGSNDPDDLIVRAFKAYEVEGKIEAEMFRHALMNFGDKFTKAEVDDIFGEFEVDDDGFIASKDVIGLFVAGGGEEKKEEEKKEEAPAEAAPEGDGNYVLHGVEKINFVPLSTL